MCCLYCSSLFWKEVCPVHDYGERFEFAFAAFLPHCRCSSAPATPLHVIHWWGGSHFEGFGLHGFILSSYSIFSFVLSTLMHIKKMPPVEDNDLLEFIWWGCNWWWGGAPQKGDDYARKKQDLIIQYDKSMTLELPSHHECTELLQTCTCGYHPNYGTVPLQTSHLVPHPATTAPTKSSIAPTTATIPLSLHLSILLQGWCSKPVDPTPTQWRVHLNSWRQGMKTVLKLMLKALLNCCLW